MLVRYASVGLFCLTLGLAPFMPEPHLVGKLRWLAGGAVGMGAMDWFDLVLHGLPWLVLVGMGLFDAVRLATGRANPEGPSPAER